MLLFNAPQTKVPSSAPKTHNSRLSILSWQVIKFSMNTSTMAGAPMVAFQILQKASTLQMTQLKKCMENVSKATGTGLLSRIKLNAAELFHLVLGKKMRTNG